jgi:hypothetical protein
MSDPGEELKANKDALEALQALATIVALLVGGIWTYVLTSQYRETAPKLTIKQSVSSWKLKDESTLLRVDSILTNAGRVRIEGISGTMIVLRLLPETDEQVTNLAKNKFYFDCEKDGGGDKNCVPEQGLNLPASSKHSFEITDKYGNLEPGESLPYWRYLRFPNDVAAVEVYTYITKPGARSDDWVFDSVFDLKTQTASPPVDRD